MLFSPIPFRSLQAGNNNVFLYLFFFSVTVCNFICFLWMKRHRFLLSVLQPAHSWLCFYFPQTALGWARCGSGRGFCFGTMCPTFGTVRPTTPPPVRCQKVTNPMHLSALIFFTTVFFFNSIFYTITCRLGVCFLCVFILYSTRQCTRSGTKLAFKKL